MIAQEDKDLIRQEMLEERHKEIQEDCRLHEDEEYALEQLVDDELIDIYSRISHLTNQLEDYGWIVNVSDMIDRLKDI